MSEEEGTVKNPFELNEPPKPVWLDQAIAKYQEKLDFAVLEPKLALRKPLMDLRFALKTYSLDFAYKKIRKVLDEKGIYIEMSAEYIAYGLELYRVWNKFRPQVWKWITDWKRELKIIAQKWKERKLRIDVMKEIAIVLNCEDILEFL